MTGWPEDARQDSLDRDNPWQDCRDSTAGTRHPGWDNLDTSVRKGQHDRSAWTCSPEVVSLDRMARRWQGKAMISKAGQSIEQDRTIGKLALFFEFSECVTFQGKNVIIQTSSRR
jgi:hypothetical protein